MDPATVAALTAAAIAATSAIIKASGNLGKTEYDKYNKAELEKLQGGQLGLTAEQKTDMNNQLRLPGLQQLADTQVLQDKPGNSAGQDYLKQLANQVVRADVASKLSGDADRQIRAANDAKVAAQKQEIEQRLAYKSMKKSERKVAALSVADQAFDAGVAESGFQKTIGQPSNAPEGVPLEWADRYKSDPEFAATVDWLTKFNETGEM